MFDAERLLSNLVRDTVMDQVGFGGRRGRKKKRKKGKNLAKALGGSGGMGLGKGAMLGVGALGLAAAAYGFMSKKGAEGAAAEAQSPSSRPPGGPPAAPPAAPMATPPPPPPPITQPIPDAPRFTQDEALLLVKAMIAAAAADGEIDAEERTHVLGELDACAPSDEDRAQVSAWLDRPPAMHEIAMAAQDPKLAEQVYAVSCLAIEVDTDAERGYLQVLARSLGIEAGRVQEINRQLGIDDA